MKSDRVQRTEAVSWTIRGRKLMWNEFSEHVQPVGTSVKWFYASQYKQKVYRSAYSGGVHIVRYGPWLQVRNYQSSVTPPMSSALSSHMLCLECIVR